MTESLTNNDDFIQMLDDVFNQMAEESTDSLLCVDDIHTIIHNESFKIIENYIHHREKTIIPLLIHENLGHKFHEFNENYTTIISQLKAERIKQNLKWGEQTHPCLDQTLLTRPGSCTPERMCEHYGIPSEVRAKFMCDNSFKKNQGTFAHIALEEFSEVISEFDIHKRRYELIQLTAVCLAWLESIDRQLQSLEK